MKQPRSNEDQERCQTRGVQLPHLRELRRSSGLTQRALGKLARISPGTVYRLETGRRGAYSVTVLKLASALGVPPEEVVRGRRRE